MPPRWLWLSIVALVGIVAAVAVPVSTFAGMRRAEERAKVTLQQLYDAQRRFRTGGGNNGYATSLASLTTPCPGSERATIAEPAPASYNFTVRAARNSRIVGTDCHGRPATSDFYVAGRPAGPLDGRLALAVTSRGRVFVFFDGVPPVEADFGFGGLAVPLESLPAFKIP